MIRNYLLVALRSLLNNKGASVINIGGLAVGFASFILIMVYVYQEFSYDRHHANAENIFRITTIDEALGVSSNNVAITMPTMVPSAMANIPGISSGFRMANGGRIRLEQGEDYVYAENSKYVEPAIFDLFNIELTDQAARLAFEEPRKLILTESMAEKTFEDSEAVGQIVSIDDEDWEVVGIMRDTDQLSHLQYDVLMSFAPVQTDSNLVEYLDSWDGLGMVGYIELTDPALEAEIEEKMYELSTSNDAPEFWRPQLQSLSDVHLGSADILFDSYNENKGDLSYVYSLSSIALFIILIAAFNFMNLTTARSSVRAREVGVRKVMGAGRRSLMSQHLGESVMTSMIAMLIAVILVIALGPLVNMGLQRELSELLMEPVIVIAVSLTTLITGVLAGLYPAVVMSNFRTIHIMKGKLLRNGKGLSLRKVLVIAQFTTSIAMIIGTVMVFRQLDYIKNKDLGFKKDQVVTFQLSDPAMGESLISFRDRLLEYEAISDASISSNMPGRTFGRTGIQPEGAADEDETWIVSALSFDDRYLKTMGMDLLDGRNFSAESGTDQREAVMVNEAFVRSLGWEEGVEKTVTLGNNSERTIIGVVKDFHFASMKHAIEPLVMFYNPGPSGNISFRIAGDDLGNALDHASEVWSDIYPQYPFDYEFFDEEFGQIYAGEEDFSRLVVSFTWLAIFIACLGLLGLSAFMAEQRRKEIGVRKVLGSSVIQIVRMLSKEFIWLILIATLIAWPAAWFGISGWLDSFAYRIDLMSGVNLLIFAASGLTALLIGLGTVSYQSIRAASENPVNALRDE